MKKTKAKLTLSRETIQALDLLVASGGECADASIVTTSVQECRSGSTPRQY